MKRYTMSASNGAVVPHESETGRWVEWEEAQKEIDLRAFWVEIKDKRIAELEALDKAMVAEMDKANRIIAELERENERLRYPDTNCSLTTPSNNKGGSGETNYANERTTT